MMNLSISRSISGLCFAALLLGAATAHAQSDRSRARVGSSSQTGTTVLGEARAEAQPLSASEPQPADRRNTRELYLSELSRYLSLNDKPLGIHLISGEGGDVSLREVRFGAAVSQILALRAGYRTVFVSRGSTPVDGKFNVVFGTDDTLSSYVAPGERERIKNGYLSLRRFGNSPEGFLLIVTGRMPDKVADAIMSLGLLKEQLPKASYASIREVVLPEDVPFMRRSPLSAGEVYTFHQLEEAGALQSTRDSKLAVEIFIPGYIATDSEVPVSVTLRFETQRKALSSNRPPPVSINGTLVSAKRRDGNVLEIQFPFNWLKPGRNVLQIDRPGGSANPADSFGGVSGDSTIELPKLDKHPSLPDLRLATRAFYPFIGEPSGKDLCIVLGSLDVETVESAWTFLARMAQSANTFFFRSELTIGELDPSRHNVVIGAYDRLPEDVKGLVNLEALKEHQVIRSVSDTPYTTGTNLQMLIEKAVKGKRTIEPTSDELSSLPSQDATPTDWGLMASASSSQDPQLWNLLLTASSSESLRTRTRDLVQPEFWEKVETDMAAWGETAESMRGRVPYTGTQVYESVKDVKFPTGDRMKVSAWLWLVAGLMILSAVITSWVLGKCDEMVVARQRRGR